MDNTQPGHRAVSEQDVLDRGAGLIERAGSPLLAGSVGVKVVVVDVPRMIVRGSRLCVPRTWLAYPIEVTGAGIAHELGHVVRLRTRASVIRSRVLRAARALAVLLWMVGCFGIAFNLHAVALDCIVAALVLGHVSCFISRRSEYLADEYATGLVEREALMRCVRVYLRMGWYRRTEEALSFVLGMATHPTPAARLRRLARTAAPAPVHAGES